MSNDKLTTNEIPKLIPLTKINLLVHPLYRSSAQPFEQVKREELSSRIIESMLPTSITEVICFMPHVDNSNKRSEIKENLIRIKANSQIYQWTDLYKDLVARISKENSQLNHNLLMSPNLVETDQHIDPQIFVQFLQNKGFKLTSDTMIVIGGEALERCVFDTIIKLMELDVVNKVYVDRNTTLGEYLLDHSEDQEQRSTARFLETIELSNFKTQIEGDLISISKQESGML